MKIIFHFAAFITAVKLLTVYTIIRQKWVPCHQTVSCCLAGRLLQCNIFPPGYTIFGLNSTNSVYINK
jgi:hypothetical protein